MSLNDLTLNDAVNTAIEESRIIDEILYVTSDGVDNYKVLIERPDYIITKYFGGEEIAF